MSIFDPVERELIDGVIHQFRNTSGRQMVDEAHTFPGWIQAWRNGDGRGAPVPFESIFWDRRTAVTPDEDEHAVVLAAEFAHLLPD